MNTIHYTLAFLGWCFRKMTAGTIENLIRFREFVLFSFEVHTALTMVLWVIITLVGSAIATVLTVVVTDSKDTALLGGRIVFVVMFITLFMVLLTNALRAFERERKHLIDTLKDFK